MPSKQVKCFDETRRREGHRSAKSSAGSASCLRREQTAAERHPTAKLQRLVAAQPLYLVLALTLTLVLTLTLAPVPKH